MLDYDSDKNSALKIANPGWGRDFEGYSSLGMTLGFNLVLQCCIWQFFDVMLNE